MVFWEEEKNTAAEDMRNAGKASGIYESHEAHAYDLYAEYAALSRAAVPRGLPLRRLSSEDRA